MKPFVVLLTLGCLALGGCATHYYEVKGDTVYFYLRDSKAKNVALASSLDNYQLHPARQVSGNKWEVALLAQSGFTYFYVIDHNAVVAPCRLKETDDFGGSNCIFNFPDP